MGKALNLEGLRFGKLTVRRRTEFRSKLGYIMWECECDCGTVRLVRSSSLNIGKSMSCGCQAYETNRIKETTHGLSKHPLYSIWRAMKVRCFNSNRFSYKDYGGRGITVSWDWMSFENFSRDMMPTYEKGLTLERIDVNGNYEKSNCKWITRSEQANNRRTTIYLDTELGVMKLKDAAALVGICWQAMYARYKNWPKERWLEKTK